MFEAPARPGARVCSVLLRSPGGEFCCCCCFFFGFEFHSLQSLLHIFLKMGTRNIKKPGANKELVELTDFKQLLDGKCSPFWRGQLVTLT